MTPSEFWDGAGKLERSFWFMKYGPDHLSVLDGRWTYDLLPTGVKVALSQTLQNMKVH